MATFTSWSTIRDEENVYGRRLASSQECPEQHSQPSYVVLMGMLLLDSENKALVIKRQCTLFLRKSMIPYVIVQDPRCAQAQLLDYARSFLKRFTIKQNLRVELSSVSPAIIQFPARVDGKCPKSPNKCRTLGRAGSCQPIAVTMVLLSAYVVPRKIQWPLTWTTMEGTTTEIQGDHIGQFESINNAVLRRWLTGAGYRIFRHQTNAFEYYISNDKFRNRYLARILRYISVLQLEFVNDKPQLEFRTTYKREYLRSIDLEESTERIQPTIELKCPQVIVYLVVAPDTVYTEIEALTNHPVLPSKIIHYGEYIDLEAEQLLSSTRLDTLYVVNRQNPRIVTIMGKQRIYEVAIFSALYTKNIGSRRYWRAKRKTIKDIQINMTEIRPLYLSSLFSDLIQQMTESRPTFFTS